MPVCSIPKTICALMLTTTILCGSSSAQPFAIERQPGGGPLLSVVDAQRGAGIFQGRCSVCHTVHAGGPNKLGPSLHGLFGRHAGTLPGYNYSAAMRASGVVWGAGTLDSYLANPHKDIPGDKMPFPGLPNKTDRDDVISYLEQATR